MKSAAGWSFSRYLPPLWKGGDIYINRLVPSLTAVHAEWTPTGETELFLCKKGETPAPRGFFDGEADIDGLEPDTDYEFYAVQGDKKSPVRLFRTGEAVGTVVNYLHPDDPLYAFSGRYLCSPSMVRTPDGRLLASMDLYEQRAPQNLTLIFESRDDGKTWHHLTELMPCFWGKLFVHKGEVYMLACSTEYGDLLIGKSTDGGKTWGTPSVLLRGSGRPEVAGVHKAPQPPLVYGGRIWEALEWGAWGAGGHAAMVMSADENSDLLDPASWVFSEPLPYAPNWPGTAKPTEKGGSMGCIEGSLTVDAAGKLVNVMRYEIHNCEPNYGLAIVYRVDTEHPENPLVFERTMAFDGSHSKFSVVRDPVSGRWYSIASRVTCPRDHWVRNLLSLMVSDDLVTWRVAKDLYDYRDLERTKTGFQYVDFIIEGDDILYLCRTALNGAHSYHDANYSTFHRIENFREL